MTKYECLCCGYKSLDTRGEFDICAVCFWEDDTYFDFSKEPIVGMYFDKEPTISELLDVPSAANNGLTLRKARENYCLFGACERDMLPYVRRPHDDEK